MPQRPIFRKTGALGPWRGGCGEGHCPSQSIAITRSISRPTGGPRAAAAWRLRCSCVGCWRYPPSPQILSRSFAGRGGVAQPAAGLTGCPCVLGRGISVTRIRTLMARRRHTTGLPPPLADSTASAAAFRRAGRQLPLSGIKILGPALICVRPEFTAALIRIHIDP